MAAQEAGVVQVLLHVVELRQAAMAGAVGGGGLGGIAINYGYYRYETDMMFLTVAILGIIVQVIQEIGMRLARVSDKRIR